MGTCATLFPSGLNLGATFNRSLWRAKGEVVSTEQRAMNNINWYRAVHPERPSKWLIGLAGYGPNINIARGASASPWEL
jgi:beta-glucosidase-like glycosyl hydrolase